MTQQECKFKFVAKNVTPYNTGKILIGGMYMPAPATRVQSRDEARIQRALLGHRATMFDALEDFVDVLRVKPMRRVANFLKAITPWK